MKIRLALIGTLVCTTLIPVATAAESEIEKNCQEKISSYLNNTIYLYKLRRCIRLEEQAQENATSAAKRKNRTDVKKHNQSMRGIDMQKATTLQRRRSMDVKLQRKILQSSQSKASISNFRAVRASRRLLIRSVEREMNEKAVERKRIQEEAEDLCENRTGAERVHCIRNKIRNAQKR